jgi:hypothetical protein
VAQWNRQPAQRTRIPSALTKRRGYQRYHACSAERLNGVQRFIFVYRKRDGYLWPRPAKARGLFHFAAGCAGSDVTPCETRAGVR